MNFNLINTAEAHVRHFSDGTNAINGSDTRFLLSSLTHIENIITIIIALVIVAIIWAGFRYVPFLKRWLSRVCDRISSYENFIPLLLRFSLGALLVGQGFANNLLSPVLTNADPFSTVQVLAGFLIFAGFLTIPSAVVAIFLFFFALFKDFYILGSLEILALTFGVLVTSNTKPSVDHALGLPEFDFFKHLKKHLSLILRIGLGTAMIFLALYEKIFNPHLAEYVVTHMHLTNIIPVEPAMWVLGAGIVELFVGLFILIGFRVRLFSFVALLVLTLSFFYFREQVSAHITLFGALVILLITNGKKTTEKFL